MVGYSDEGVMYASVNIVDRSGLRETVKKFPEATEKALGAATILGMFLIKDRTSKGISVEGKLFKPYSPRYMQWKTEHGHPSHPNLNLHGRMLGSMTTGYRKQVGRIYFARKEETYKAIKNEKSRPFFNLNEKERKQVALEFENEFFDLI
jgi:hypothetical protein